MRAPVPLLEDRRDSIVAVTPAAVPSPSPQQSAHEEEEHEKKQDREKREEPKAPRVRPHIHIRRSRRRWRRDDAATLGYAVSPACIVGSDADRYRANHNQRGD